METLTPLTFAFLLLAAACAGFIDAIAGGGGLIQLPSMLAALPHTETVTLLGTNKVSANLGTTASALTYRRRVKSDPKLLLAMVIPALMGSAGGALLASFIPTKSLKPIVFLLLIAVVIYTWKKPTLGEVESLRHHPHLRMKIASMSALGIGFYDGLIGPGTGSFLLLIFVAVLGYAFLQASAMAKVVNVATNLGAIIVFGIHGVVWWKLGLAMGVFNIAGGLIGARVAIRGGSTLVRKVFLLMTTLLILKIGIDIASTW